MVRKFAEFQGIDNKYHITKEESYEFLYHLQKALLLGFKEQGRLSATQYRHAEEHLKQQRRDRVQKLLRNGGARE